MTPRERVLCTIEHREPDRVPIDVGGMRSTGLTAVAYARLKRHLGQPGDVLVYDVIQQLAQPDDTFLDWAGADVVDLGRAFLTRPEEWQEWALPDGTPAKIPAHVRLEPRPGGGWLYRHPDGTVLGEMPPGVLYLSQVHWPWLNVERYDEAPLEEAMGHVTWGAIPTAPWHLPFTPEGWAQMRATAKAFYEQTDRAVMVAFGGNLLEWGQFLRRIDQFLMDLAGDRARVSRFLDRLTERHIRALEQTLDAIGDCIDLIQMGDDMGLQTGPQISPRMYRELLKPRHREIYAVVKRKSRAKVFLHSCGSIAALIPDLIDIGVDVINPVQTSAADMDPGYLKREFGKDITFWGGGCDTQEVLPHGTAEQIDAHVRDRIATLAPGGGFVFCQVHNVMPNVPPENAAVMYQAARRYGASVYTR